MGRNHTPSPPTQRGKQAVCFRLSLRTKLIGSLLLLSVGILIASTSLLSRYSVDRLKDDAASYRFLVLGSFTLMMNSTLDTVREGMSFLGRLLARRELSIEERTKRIQDWMKSSEYLSKISVFHPQGNKLFTVSWKEKKHSLDAPSSLSSAMMKQAMIQNTLYFPVQFGSDHKSYLPILMPFLLQEKTKTVGYIWTALELSSLFGRMQRLVKRRKANLPIDSIYLVDRNLRMFLHSQKPITSFQRLSWFPQELAEQSKEGMKSTIVYEGHILRKGHGFLFSVQFPLGSPYGLVVEQSIAGLEQFVGGVRKRAIWFGTGFAALALFLGFFFGGRLAKPILRIANASEQVAQGDFSVRVNIPHRDEVGDMARSFNVMASSLEKYRAQIVEETCIRTELGRYLSSELVEGIVDKTMQVKLGGERRKVTVLFADIVAFTKVVEHRDPEQVVAILNELFTFFTEIIFKHGGIIDKFMGDCVMAVFGAPYQHAHDAIHAVSAAEEMKRWLEVGNARWARELGHPLEIGMGIHTGEALAGNVGSQKRMEYTVIGDTVNLAARLESLARPGQILLSQSTAQEVENEFVCVSLGLHSIQGREKPVEIYMLAEE